MFSEYKSINAMAKTISFSVPNEWADKLQSAFPKTSLNLAAKQIIEQFLTTLDGSLVSTLDGSLEGTNELREEINQLKAEIAEIKQEYVTQDHLEWALETGTQKTDDTVEEHKEQIAFLFELYSAHDAIVRQFKELADKELLDQEKIKRIIEEGYGIPDDWLAFHTKLDVAVIVDWRTGKLKKKPLKLNYWNWDKTYQLWYFEPPTLETIARKGFPQKV
jgi:archaellum component FlaC